MRISFELRYRTFLCKIGAIGGSIRRVNQGIETKRRGDRKNCPFVFFSPISQPIVIRVARKKKKLFIDGEKSAGFRVVD